MGPRDATPATESPPERSRPPALAMAKGAAAGALVGLVTTAFEFVVHRGQGGLPELSWPTSLVAYPIMGALVGWFIHRNPEARARKGRRGRDFFAAEPMPDAKREERMGRVRRSAWTGFAVGVAAAVAAAAVDFAWRAWPYVGGTLAWGLIVFPYFGALFGFNMGLRRGDPKPTLRDARFGVRTLMILTAYLALLLGLGLRISRVSFAARSSLMRSQGARETAEVYRKVLEQNRADVGRSANAEALRAGRIPDGLDPSQAEFLRSLDGTATEEHKKYRYGLIADGEQRRADAARSNVDLFGRLVEHQERLAEKYAKAAREPWLPVDPDPPMPR